MFSQFTFPSPHNLSKSSNVYLKPNIPQNHKETSLPKNSTRPERREKHNLLSHHPTIFATSQRNPQGHQKAHPNRLHILGTPIIYRDRIK